MRVRNTNDCSRNGHKYVGSNAVQASFFQLHSSEGAQRFRVFFVTYSVSLHYSDPEYGRIKSFSTRAVSDHSHSGGERAKQSAPDVIVAPAGAGGLRTGAGASNRIKMTAGGCRSARRDTYTAWTRFVQADAFIGKKLQNSKALPQTWLEKNTDRNPTCHGRTPAERDGSGKPQAVYQLSYNIIFTIGERVLRRAERVTLLFAAYVTASLINLFNLVGNRTQYALVEESYIATDRSRFPATRRQSEATTYAVRQPRRPDG
ncbi:hypothetical protein EVAR_22315_1 [Eumeta japonica]|uniref:Uncharacterized protein n=1 Tax=Eumeta variegata TaxID=151549 RepID=A0A4C1UAL4_EUMVA|nr:hypothetical protein EVAR_22315_1 [Eumeta japonica]